MFGFLASDTGLVVSWVMLALGAADMLIGWLWLGRGRGMEAAEREMPALRRWLPAVLIFDALLVAVGLYGVRLHGVF